MNTEYLNKLPEIENKYQITLQENEKIIFVSELSTFGDEKDNALGWNCSLTLTNQRIIINNNVNAVWTINIADDIASCTKVEERFMFFFKAHYFSIVLNEEMTYDYGKAKLKGFHFYFKDDAKQDIIKFEEIMNNLFNKN